MGNFTCFVRKQNEFTNCIIFLLEPKIYLKISPANYIIIFFEKYDRIYNVMQNSSSYQKVNLEILLTYPRVINKVAKLFLFNEASILNNYFKELIKIDQFHDSDKVILKFNKKYHGI